MFTTKKFSTAASKVPRKPVIWD